jgi:hypothetical protein
VHGFCIDLKAKDFLDTIPHTFADSYDGLAPFFMIYRVIEKDGRELKPL